MSYLSDLYSSDIDLCLTVSMMRCLVQKKTYLVILSPLLLFALLLYWTRRAPTTVDVGQGQSYKAQKVLKERLQNVQNSYDNIPYVLKESVAG